VHGKIFSDAQQTNKQKKKGFLWTGKGAPEAGTPDNSISTTISDASHPANTTSSPFDFTTSAQAHSNTQQLFSGYLSMKSGGLFSSPWVRRFVVLRNNFLVYYTSKQDFENRPNNPVNKRPINFNNFDVNVEVTDTFYRILLTPGRGEYN
jgi:hypothetical protein